VSLIKDTLSVSIVAIVLFFAIDFVVGDLLLEKMANTYTEKDYRISHDVFHHTLASSFQGYGIWGAQQYKICTNSLGFKSPCDSRHEDKSEYDIVIIGDSVTEAIGMEYEDSFVGLASYELPHLKVANMGVSSYSPSIYYSKLKHYIDRGLKVAHVIVYVDISDMQDEAVNYMLSENGRVLDGIAMRYGPAASSLKVFLKNKFSLTYYGIKIAHEFIYIEGIGVSYLSYEFDRSAWTYNNRSVGYGEKGVDASIEKTLDVMKQLFGYLQARNIKLSIGVYPWPAQLLHDTEHSRQAKIWSEFCETRCVHFINSFPSLFSFVRKTSASEVIEKYYIDGDIHFNRQGNMVLKKDLMKFLSLSDNKLDGVRAHKQWHGLESGSEGMDAGDIEDSESIRMSNYD